MKTQAWIVAAALVLAVAAPPARAGELAIGHVAPGIGDVQLFAGDKPLGPVLSYGSFVHVEVTEDAIEVEVRDRDGSGITRGVFVPGPDDVVTPMLVVTGDGTRKPVELQLYKGNGRRLGVGGGRSAVLGLHHLSPYAEPDSPAFPGATLVCRDRNSLTVHEWNSAASGGPVRFGDSLVLSFAVRGEPLNCELVIDAPAFGRIGASVELVAGRTTRIIFSGDSRSEPLALTTVDGTPVVTTIGHGAPLPSELLSAESVWLDPARPGQVVTLYETDASTITGFWATHRDDGQPEWYFMDGIRNRFASGSRDLTLYRISAEPGREPSSYGGTARIFYIDCNQAEVRLITNLDNRLQTLRLQRSRPVAGCELFD